MPKKPDQTQNRIANDIQTGATAAQQMARNLAAITAPADALKDVTKGITAYTDSLKTAALPVAEITNALSQVNGAAEAIKKFHVSLPTIDVKLPDFSGSIKATLPRPLNTQSAEAIPTPTDIDGKDLVGEQPSPDEDVTPITTPEDLGHMVRRAREVRALSQQAFADLAGVGRRFVSELENGKATLEFGKVLKVTRAAGLVLFARER